jgi:hypothetical protein
MFAFRVKLFHAVVRRLPAATKADPVRGGKGCAELPVVETKADPVRGGEGCAGLPVFKTKADPVRGGTADPVRGGKGCSSSIMSDQRAKPTAEEEDADIAVTGLILAAQARVQ